MGRKDRRVDEYIAKSAQYAQPILAELRSRVHAAIPGVAETIKWSAPCFEYQGKLIANMAAFKQHCSFGWWHPLMRAAESGDAAMAKLGRVATVKDLPTTREFERLAKRARQLIDEGAKAPAKPKAERAPLAVPKDLAAALRRDAAAAATWDSFSYSHRKEYIEWLEDAKTAQTRERRLATTIDQLAEGKPKNWKYQRQTAQAGPLRRVAARRPAAPAAHRNGRSAPSGSRPP